MRLKPKTILIVAISLVCGSSLYVALFSSSDRDLLRAYKENVPDGVNTGEEVLITTETEGQGAGWVDGNLRNQNVEQWKQQQAPPIHVPSATQRHLHDGVSKFTVRQPFHFPQPAYSLPDRQLLQSDWVASLKLLLSQLQGKQISMVTSTQEHIDVLVNWLISAHVISQPPLENVLVLSLGEELHQLMVRRGILSLLVTPEMVISPAAGIDAPFSQVHVVRLTVLRLIVHFGYMVVNYDCDAIVLKNPQIIFDKFKDADIIATFGKGPRHLFTMWGVTLNTGVLMFRNNSKVEHFWESMSMLPEPTTDDQGNVNLVLEQLRVRWMNIRPHYNIDDFHHEIYGFCDRQLIVVLLPFDVICRHTCAAQKRHMYYVWHALAIKENRTVENKISQARVGKAWFLKEAWEGVSEDITGLDWLRSIMR